MPSNNTQPYKGVPVSRSPGAIRSIGDVATELEVGNDFLAELQQKASTTQRGYVGNIRLFFEYFLNRKPTSSDVEEFWGLDGEVANS
ncbi:MAG: hypothetical protein WBF90_33245, partial [Rivularia sp. (in: cyanobacteria)]